MLFKFINSSFIPCASCLHPAFNVDYKNKLTSNKVGLIVHGLDAPSFLEEKFNKISNNSSMHAIVDFILSFDPKVDSTITLWIIS